MKVRSSSSRMPTRCSSKPGTMRSLPMTSGKRSAAAPSTGSPSRRPSKRMTAKSPSWAGRSSTGTSVACWSRSCSTTWSTWVSVTSSTWGWNGKPRVVAQLDLRSDRQAHAVRGPDALLEAGPLGLRGHLQDAAAGFRDGLDDRALVEVLACLVVDGVARRRGRSGRRPGHARGCARGCLAWAEARHARAAREVADALVDGLLELLGGELDLEHDRAVVAVADVGLHGVLVRVDGMPVEYRERDRAVPRPTLGASRTTAGLVWCRGQESNLHDLAVSGS